MSGLDGLQITRAAGARGAPEPAASKPASSCWQSVPCQRRCNAEHVQIGGPAPPMGLWQSRASETDKSRLAEGPARRNFSPDIFQRGLCLQSQQQLCASARCFAVRQRPVRKYIFAPHAHELGSEREPQGESGACRGSLLGEDPRARRCCPAGWRCPCPRSEHCDRLVEKLSGPKAAS